MSLNLTNTATAGESGELDKIGLDVEDGNGGSGDDTIVGNSSDNLLNGNAGTDTVTNCGGGSDIVLNAEVFSGAAASNCGITVP